MKRNARTMIAVAGLALTASALFTTGFGPAVASAAPVEVKRKRGRPRKHPKPVLVVDETPIPDWVA